MQRRALANPVLITAILVLQFIPLVLFPPESFSATTQEWWLPVLLAVMVIIAVISLIVRHTAAVWPWVLISFSQGFNLISRLMMVWPHATTTVNKVNVVNVPYITLTLISILMSVFMLWYTELPDIRTGLLQQ